tara:strand:+ start:4049 stop:4366 length:318 start_codon:yes stop_codon:yes gene_type:complete
MDLTAEQIARILTNYKNKRQRENKYYHEVTKTKEEFKLKNRERAKKHYNEGYKEKRKQNYDDNKDFIKNKSLFNYYKKKDKIDVFKEKHKEKYEMLIEKKFITSE